jgi:hypothetical protein
MKYEVRKYFMFGDIFCKQYDIDIIIYFGTVARHTIENDTTFYYVWLIGIKVLILCMYTSYKTVLRLTRG